MFSSQKGNTRGPTRKGGKSMKPIGPPKNAPGNKPSKGKEKEEKK